VGHVKIVKKLQENYEDKFLKIKENSLYLNRESSEAVERCGKR